MLSFYFIVSFFQFKKKKEKKKALIIYQHLLHTFLVYADFLLLLHFLLSSTETCTVNVDVHNFFCLKKEQKITVKTFDHSIVVLSKNGKKKYIKKM